MSQKHYSKRFLFVLDTNTGEAFEVNMEAGKRAFKTLLLQCIDREIDHLDFSSSDPALASYAWKVANRAIYARGRHSVKCWAFDCMGDQYVDTFLHENLAYKWAKDHALSIWHMGGK